MHGLSNHLDLSVPLPRKKIEQYSYGLADSIGKGYSSVVYRGRNDQTGKSSRIIVGETVGIKVIDLKGLVDRFAKEMLQSYIEALKELHHPNILACWDVFTTQNNCYIIMEFCGDGDLAKMLSRKGRFEYHYLRPLISDILMGFVEMAGRGYVHRDLKPANILIKDGGARIADFGFAKKYMYDRIKCSVNGKPEKYNVGSPLYMSPEALSQNIYSTKSDIWALGVMLYELLTGKTPWYCQTEKELLEKITLERVQLPEYFSREVRYFLYGCLQPREESRFGLKELLNSEYVSYLMKFARLSARSSVSSSLPMNAVPQSPFSGSQNMSIFGRIRPRYTANQSGYDKENRCPDILRRPESQNNSFTAIQVSSEQIKYVIKNNNTVLVNYINSFRLLYKMLEQIKKHFTMYSHLIHVLSQYIRTRVTYLKAVLSNELGAGSACLGHSYLRMLKKYLCHETNPSIRRYKLVVNEYYKKYTNYLCVNEPDVKGTDLRSCLVTFLKMNDSHDKVVQHTLLYHWVLEYLEHRQGQLKTPLDEIIYPKEQPTSYYVRNRLRELRPSSVV